MGLFSKAPKVGADGYERKAMRGYADKGPVAKLLAEGWEVESFTPSALVGTTLKQGTFLLKRKASS
jgi:hypothetical protein